MLIRTEKLMDLHPVVNPGGRRRFTSNSEDDGSVRCEIWLAEDEWQEMGEPKVITVRINPGDHLNGVVRSMSTLDVSDV